MVGPGMHELSAQNMASNNDIAGATVEAILALAAAVNRLADAHRDLVNIEMDRERPLR